MTQRIIQQEPRAPAEIARHALGERRSPTALERYRRCPKQFFLTDIERRRYARSASPTLAQANAIHDALFQFYGLPLDERRPQRLERALRAVWRRHCVRGTFRSEAEEIAFGRSAIEMLVRYAEVADLRVRPLAREQWLGVFVGGVELYGKLDRVDAGQDGGIDIIDYKTGARRLEPEDMRHESAVQVYTLSAESAFAKPVERVRLVYLSDATEVVWEPERDDIEWLGEQLTRLLAEIRADELFAARPGPYCGWCPHALICEERQQTTLDDIPPDSDLPF